MDYDKIGEFIKEKRKEKNLTQNDLARILGVTNKAISKWECGLGCPDISLLESLSKELDVSILELLNGNKIDEKNIEICDTNKYIKESIEYSKNQTKIKYITKINIVIEAFIVAICIILVILNINSSITMNKKYKYIRSDSEYEDVEKYISKLDYNISIIKNDKGIFTADDYRKMNEYIDKENAEIKKHPLLKEKKEYELDQNGIYIIGLENGSLNYVNFGMYLFNILQKYDSSLSVQNDLYKVNFLKNTTASFLNYNTPLETYKYNINIFGKSFIEEYNGYLTMKHFYYDAKNRLINLVYITELIIKVGELNE